MTLGKHVYCQKPLTHSVYESRLLTKLAASTNVATQMGNQGSSAEGTELGLRIGSGTVKSDDITKVECATDRPIWPQGLNTPEKARQDSFYLNWDLFTGPAELKPFNKIYHPWNWRGWWTYGTGALGDMACHIMHTAFKALKLGYPTSVGHDINNKLLSQVSTKVKFSQLNPSGADVTGTGVTVSFAAYNKQSAGTKATYDAIKAAMGQIKYENTVNTT